MLSAPLAFAGLCIGCGGTGSVSPLPFFEPGTLNYRLGMNTYVLANQESASEGFGSGAPYEQFSNAASAAREFGAGHMRSPADWQFWNQSVGDTSWVPTAAEYFGRRQRALALRGMNSYVVCTTARGSVAWPTNEAGIESYCKNVVAIVNAYTSRLNSPADVEIGNEVTNDSLWSSSGSRDAYVEIVRRTKQKLDASGFGATRIWASSVSNGSGAVVSQVDFLNFCITSGIDGNVDGYVLNLYKGHTPNSYPEDNISDLQSFLAATSKPVRIGEFGYHTLSWTSEEQTALDLRAFLSILIGAGARADVRAALYEIRDRGDGGNGWCDGARTPGCVPIEGIGALPAEARFGLVTQSLQPKSGSGLWRRFFNELGSFTFVSGGNVSGIDYEVNLIASDGRSAVVTWKRTLTSSDPGYAPSWVITPAPRFGG